MYMPVPVGGHAGDERGMDLQLLVQEYGRVHLQVGLATAVSLSVAHKPIKQIVILSPS
jgi:hypothetical protein